MAAQYILKAAGVQDVNKKCDFACNGKIAVEIIKNDVKQNKRCTYDLILMDQNMPVMDGATATRNIREFLYQHELAQPIICGVTGHTEQEYVKRAMEHGMNMVYSKPLNLNLLKALLKSINYI